MAFRLVRVSETYLYVFKNGSFDKRKRLQEGSLFLFIDSFLLTYLHTASAFQDRIRAPNGH
jgi:hypothetical protein